MITLKSPITKSREIIGYDIMEFGESPAQKHVRASVRIFYDDDTNEVRDLRLWDGEDTPAKTKIVDGEEIEEAPAVAKANSYADAGDWTQARAEKRIEELLAQ